jgi:GAF domain-containing protein
VRLIQRRFATDVCSVYLLEPDRTNLVLAATIGLRPEGVGRVRMRLDEGLVGLVGEQMRPQVVEDATKHPRFSTSASPARTPTTRSWACQWSWSWTMWSKGYIPAAGDTSSAVSHG